MVTDDSWLVDCVDNRSRRRVVDDWCYRAGMVDRACNVVLLYIVKVHNLEHVT